jgi:sporulation protein YlmC with PRC-barrel domain
MVKLQTQHILRALAIVAAMPLAVSAQQAPSQPQSEAPAAARPAPPGTPPTTEPGADVVPPSPKAPAVRPSTEAPAAPTAQDLVGLNVFSSDGTRIGEVRAVNTGSSGDIVALHIRTGGFLGFGGRIVAIPQGKFMRSGQSIRLDLDSDEVSGLPEVKD